MLRSPAGKLERREARATRPPVGQGGRQPLSSMFDWVSRLRGLTSGRGTVLVKLDGYDTVPAALAQSLLERP
jgi:translation elongation factor EF-G